MWRSLFSEQQGSPCYVNNGGYTWEVLGEEDQWREYNIHFGSYDSAGIERQYQQNPQGKLHFRVNFKRKSFTYTLDFSRMRQLNHNTRTERIVRRTANTVRRISDSGSQQSSSGPRWQFKDNGDVWKDFYKGRVCSVSSEDIEHEYRQNRSGSMIFITNNYTYQLDFSAMTQRNLSTNTTRQVRRRS